MVAVAIVTHDINPVVESVCELARLVLVNFATFATFSKSQLLMVGVHLYVTELLPLGIIWNRLHDVVCEGKGWAGGAPHYYSRQALG